MLARLTILALMAVTTLGMDRGDVEMAKSPDPWTRYFGIQDREAQWAGTRRGIIRRNSGWELFDGTTIGSELYLERLDTMAEKIRTASPTADLIVPVGAVLSGRDPEQFRAYAELIEGDGGRTWKRVIKDQARAASAAVAAGRSLYWQVDNEINNRHMVASAGKHMGWSGADSFDDPRLVEIYAEYILAPTIEALEEVREAGEVPDDHARIMLGSIANATRASSEDWMNALVGYQFDGRFAESLKDSRVADHVEIVTMHYVATRDERIDQGVLARTFDRWMGEGAITGVWMTEELGKARARKGLGALTAIRLMAGYMQLVTADALRSSEVRCSFWGATAGEPEANAVTGLNTVYEFLGDGALTDISKTVEIGGVTAAARVYSFLNEGTSRQMVFVSSVERERRNAVRSIEVDDRGSVTSLQVYMVSAAGLQDIDFAWDGPQAVLDERVKIGPASGVLALVGRRNIESE